MKCVFCAEEILPEAILCRFCGALKHDGVWQAPGSIPAKHEAPRGSFTLRTAGLFYLVSAAIEVLFITSEVPLLGAIRSGPVAILYHLIYAGIFLVLGLGLLGRKRWGFRALLGGTIFYTVDKVLYLLDRDTMNAQIESAIDPYRELLATNIDADSITQLTVLMTLLILACSWGFVYFVHRHASYFRD